MSNYGKVLNETGYEIAVNASSQHVLLAIDGEGWSFTRSDAIRLARALLKAAGKEWAVEYAEGKPDDCCDQCGAIRAFWQTLDETRCPAKSCDGVLRKAGAK